jgi:hypothetical protein
VSFDERPECTKQSDCNGFGILDPHVCREQKCVALRNDGEAGGDCKLVLGQEGLKESESPFVFGALSAVGSATDPLSPVSLLYDLVVQEFQRKGGLTLAGRSQAPVAVVCDVADVEPSALERTFDHLVGTLGVAGVITALPAPDLKQAFERVHHDQGKSVLFVSPYPSEPLLESIDDDGLLWHMMGPPEDVGRAYAPLIRRAENYVNPPDAAGSRPPIRLALVNSDTSLTSEMASLVESTLVLNGVSAAENGSAFYRRFVLSNADSYAKALEELVEFRPHIVVSVADDQWIYDVLFPLEVNWPEDTEQERPFYVLSPFQVDSEDLLALVADPLASARTRMAGVSLSSLHESPVYRAFQSNVNATYALPVLENMENFYDAPYFLLYAAAASNVGRPGGADLARGMLRLLEGTPLAVGEEDIPAVLAELNAGPNASVALEGTLGPPDFDVETGARKHTPSSAFCITGGGDEPLAYRHDALRYDPERDVLTGSFDCFPFPEE